MQRSLLLSFAVIALLGLVLGAPRSVSADQNGGVDCAGCTIMISLADQLSVINEQPIDQVINNLCNYLPAPADLPCREFMNAFGDAVISMLLQGLNADDVCESLNFCNKSGVCRLWPKNSDETPEQERARKELVETYAAKMERVKMVGLTPWQWILQEINVLAQKHEPLVDFDGDLFGSFTDTLRGAYWRGRDCDDYNGNRYPGRKVPGTNTNLDHNCNGISGVDSQGNNYEDLLCKDTGMRGVAILGDSAAAHFHIPETYMDAKKIHEGTYKNFMTILETEFDWPQFSWATGHLNTTNTDCPGPMESIYHKMWQRNHCNFRDFQNIGVNGARVGSMIDIEKSLKRNHTLDHPMLVFYALIGNDVCSSGHSLNDMTTPSQFYQSVMTGLTQLDTMLPAGSHVVFIGLVDGRILWDTMWNRTHPIGTTYADVYAFLNCLEVNPCWAWLNSNETIRNAGSARAAELNQVYVNITKTQKFKNFDTLYMAFPMPQIIKVWTQAGGQVADLIEPIDGFHPSQTANYVAASVIWQAVESQRPDFLGPVNPNNDRILQLFGNQGGY